MQESLFDHPIEQAHPPTTLGYSIKENFEIFNRDNPHVYRMIRKIALDLKLTGHRRMGMKAIFERIRWLYAIQTKGEVFKLNNSYTALYSRLLMEQEPELKGFFEVRNGR